jgi:thiamine biosynthesis lipoprotein
MFNVWIGLALLVTLLGGCSTSQRLSRYEFARPLMGTRVRVALYESSKEAASAAADAAFDRIAALNMVMSDYEPQSEVNRLCATAGSGTAVPLSEDLLNVLMTGQKFSQASGGAFDVTVGSVVRQWRRARRTFEMPSREDLDKALATVGYQSLVIDPQQRTATLTKPDMRIDLGGIGKGFAADEAIKALKARGVRHAMVDAGGNVAAADAPPGQPGWRIALMPMPKPLVTEAIKEGQEAAAGGGEAQPPTGGEAKVAEQPKVEQYILLANGGIATSGDSFQHVVLEGKRYSHIVDPRTGLGLTEPMAVTVVASDATTADALSTTVSVLGPERGFEVADGFDAAVIVFVQQADGTIKRVESTKVRSVPMLKAQEAAAEPIERTIFRLQREAEAGRIGG